VNSTISLEGIVQWYASLGEAKKWVRYGCFEFDPFGSFLSGNVGMVEQDVVGMLRRTFELVGKQTDATINILVPCRLLPF